MIKIQIFEETEIRDVRKWCIQNFGKIPLKSIDELDKNKRIGIRYKSKFSGDYIYDVKNCSWIHRFNSPLNFYFKNQEDAIAFKLRWL